MISVSNNDTQHIDGQHYDTKHKRLLYCDTQHNNTMSLCSVSRFIYCYAECRYAECRYAEGRYAECHYAECRGAIFRVSHKAGAHLSKTLFENLL
jgi:hypothetical protein